MDQDQDQDQDPTQSNPITFIEISTEDGTVLRWTFDEPVEQAKIMFRLGILFADVSSNMPELSLPEPRISLHKEGSANQRQI